mmetsp:Transcript_11065/g.23637  ORF Transcript_11065/g.23637 Transcript_11065/m.23637 type:complete len:204 (+) Transcript_11065:977-1588(+)
MIVPSLEGSFFLYSSMTFKDNFIKFCTAANAWRLSGRKYPYNPRKGFVDDFKTNSTKAISSCSSKSFCSSGSMTYSKAVSTIADKTILIISVLTSKDVSFSGFSSVSFIQASVFSKATLDILFTCFEENAGAIDFRFACQLSPFIVIMTEFPANNFSDCALISGGFSVRGSVMISRTAFGSPTTNARGGLISLMGRVISNTCV